MKYYTTENKFTSLSDLLVLIRCKAGNEKMWNDRVDPNYIIDKIKYTTK